MAQPPAHTKKIFLLGSSSKWRRGVLESTLRRYFSDDEESAGPQRRQRVLNPSASDEATQTLRCGDTISQSNATNVNTALPVAIVQLAPDIDEEAIRDPNPRELVLKIARAKMDEVLAKTSSTTLRNKNGSGAPHQRSDDPSNNNNNSECEWIVTGDQMSVYFCKSSDDPMLTQSCNRCAADTSVGFMSSSGGSHENDADSGSKLLIPHPFPLLILGKPESVEENKLFLRSYRNHSITTVASQVLFHIPTRRQFEGIDINTVHFGDISEDVIDEVIGRGDSLQCCGGFVVEDEALSRCISKIDGCIEGVQGLGPKLLCSLLDQSLGL